MTKELNLQKFIHRQRVQTNAMMGLLTGYQQFFVHRLSKLYIKENVYSSSDSPDEELLVVDKDEMRYLDKMAASATSKHPSAAVDRRFFNFYKVIKDECAAVLGKSVDNSPK